MKLGLYYRCIVTDKNGKVVKRTHWKKSRSFVKQFLQNLSLFIGGEYGVFNQVGNVADVGNVLRTLAYLSTLDFHYYFRAYAPDDAGNYGIVVGTGTLAPTNADYALGTQITHGVGAGQLDYGATSQTAADIVGANVDFILSRTFYNGSGASITVNEVGIIAATLNSDNATSYFLIVRDVITAIAVANTQTLTVQYTFRTTV